MNSEDMLFGRIKHDVLTLSGNNARFRRWRALEILPASPKYAAVHINPQAFEKKFIFVGFLS